MVRKKSRAATPEARRKTQTSERDAALNFIRLSQFNRPPPVHGPRTSEKGKLFRNLDDKLRIIAHITSALIRTLCRPNSLYKAAANPKFDRICLASQHRECLFSPALQLLPRSTAFKCDGVF